MVIEGVHVHRHGQGHCWRRRQQRECGASFLAISPSVLMSKWVGESVRVVRACFSLAAKLAPCVLFLDEVSIHPLHLPDHSRC